MAPPDRHVLYVLEPVPNLDGQVDWDVERTRRASGCRRRSTDSATRRYRGRAVRRPTRLGGAGHGAGHAVRAVAPVLPDRSVPARATSSAARPAWCSPAAAPFPASACRWCWSPAGSQPNAVGAGRRPDDGDDSPRSSRTRTVAALNKRYGTTYYWSTFALPRGQAPPRVGAVRVLPPGRRHRRRPR